MIAPHVGDLGTLQLLMWQGFQQFYLCHTFIWGDVGGTSEQLFGLKEALYTDQLQH